MNALRNVLTEIINESLNESASWKLQFDLAVSVTKQKIMVTRDRSVSKMTLQFLPPPPPNHLWDLLRFYMYWELSTEDAAAGYLFHLEKKLITWWASNLCMVL
jgi:hypothetical protein